MSDQSVVQTLESMKNLWTDLLHKCGPSSVNFEFLNLDTLQKFGTFFEKYGADCFERTNQFGHFTGSALLVSEDLEQVLLTFHRKLNRWLQLGGHADGDHDLARVAEKEAIEESGLPSVKRLCWGRPSAFLPFDVDIHLIPEIKVDPAHYHFDVRYLFTTSTPEKILISDESEDLRWFSLEEAKRVCDDPSTNRQLDKFLFLRRNRLLF